MKDGCMRLSVARPCPPFVCTEFEWCELMLSYSQQVWITLENLVLACTYVLLSHKAE
jgi:hypothetical protein